MRLDLNLLCMTVKRPGEGDKVKQDGSYSDPAFDQPSPLPLLLSPGRKIMIRFLMIALAVVCLAVPAPASAADDENINPLNRDWLMTIPQGVWGVVKRPFDLSDDALIQNALVAGGLGALFLLDEEIQDIVLDIRNVDDTREDTGSQGPSDIRELGDLYVLTPALGVTYLAGEISGSSRLRRTGLLGLQSLWTAAVTTEGLKYVFGRTRPADTQNGHRWAPFSEKNAFPSGHATQSFAVATVVAHEFGDIPWVPWAAYGLAGAVSLSRVYDNRHWASDVFAGAAIGYGVGRMIVGFDAFGPDDRISLAPWTKDGAQGVQLAVKF